MSGGTGTNTFIADGSYLINSEGFGGATGGDTIIAGSGSSTVNATGPNASVVGGGGELFVTASGVSDSVVGGGGETHATLTGSDGVVSGNRANLSVLDEDAGDTINAGSGFTSVDAPGGSFVNGGEGQLNFVGGTGPLTLLGGSGNSTVFGGDQLSSVVSGAGARSHTSTQLQEACGSMEGVGKRRLTRASRKAPAPFTVDKIRQGGIC
jgi:hypothetical protein